MTAIAHGSFFAIGATVAARLAPEGQASRAIAMMFAGLTLAMVIGVPLGSLIGNGLGWRVPLHAVAALAALALLATALWVPKLSMPPAGKAATQLAALRQPAILSMMAVTLLGFGASFAAFTFVTPILTGITGFTTNIASLLLVVFGAATLVGNLTGGRLAASLGWQTALRRMLVALLVTLVALALLMPYKLPMVALLFVWGALAFGMSPGFQAGMLTTAERDAPRAVDFASALNISAFNLGITLGETLGSAMVARDHMALTPWAGVALVVLAQAPLAWLVRRSSRSIPVPCGWVMGTRHGVALRAFATPECPRAKDAFGHLRRWIACNPAYFAEPAPCGPFANCARAARWTAAGEDLFFRGSQQPDSSSIREIQVLREEAEQA
ncbi:Predicted arabinose efflux permease, MFS family [Azotobacter beijerinckii]|uniref:Predicted arabinose efflux permease, MFS family n=1 Tax=Azotobacter beijerinckii TaxID=170623 RepID=A0A1H6ZLF4_9GAMM|nr:Predicted arabinose efflux permease, MFS family [Azotobacter beijerinckii]